MDLLPDECIIDILSHLSAKDLLFLSLVNKRFNQISTSEYLWKRLLKRDFHVDTGYQIYKHYYRSAYAYMLKIYNPWNSDEEWTISMYRCRRDALFEIIKFMVVHPFICYKPLNHFKEKYSDSNMGMFETLLMTSSFDELSSYQKYNYLLDKYIDIIIEYLLYNEDRENKYSFGNPKIKFYIIPYRIERSDSLEKYFHKLDEV